MHQQAATADRNRPIGEPKRGGKIDKGSEWTGERQQDDQRRVYRQSPSPSLGKAIFAHREMSIPANSRKFGGTCGSSIAQLCRKYFGARSTTPTATSDHFRLRVELLGADHVALLPRRLRGYDHTGNHAAPAARQTRAHDRAISFGAGGFRNPARRSASEPHWALDGEAAFTVTVVCTLADASLIFGRGRTPQLSRIHADLLLLLAAAFWGFGNVAQKTVLEHLDPLSAVGLRCLIAGLVVLPLVASERRPKVGWSYLTSLVRVSGLFAVSIVIQQ